MAQKLITQFLGNTGAGHQRGQDGRADDTSDDRILGVEGITKHLVGDTSQLARVDEVTMVVEGDTEMVVTIDLDTGHGVDDDTDQVKTGVVTPSVSSSEKHPDTYCEEDIQAGTAVEHEGMVYMKGGKLLNNGGKNDMMVENVDIQENNELEKRLLGSVNDDVVADICVFKRGVCQVHKLKGKKSVNKTKKWGKVKSGYGWIYSQTVKYTCPRDTCLDRQNSPD